VSHPHTPSATGIPTGTAHLQQQNAGRSHADTSSTTSRYAQCGAIATDVDHIIAFDNGRDPYNPLNLEALCHPCHSTKTSHEMMSTTPIQAPLGQPDQPIQCKTIADDHPDPLVPNRRTHR
jgi:hypothetical protein